MSAKGYRQLPPPELANEIDRWLQKTARGQRRLPSLYTSLLTGRVFAYLSYRLRYPFALSTVQFLVHVAEFLLILSSLGGLAAFTVMVLRIGSLIVGGAWWGLLEVMRERLRRFARAGEHDAAEHEIGRWLVLAVILAAALIVGAAIVLARLRPSGDDPVADFYAFLVVVELAINFPVRVLHSGVFATRRVYRPAWAMFGSPVVQLAVLGVGFYYYPAVAIIISIIAANAIAISVTVHYSLEAYRLIGIRPKAPTPTYAFWRMLPRVPPVIGVETTLSGLALRLDAVLVLAIVGVYGTHTRSFDLTAAVPSWREVDTFQFFYLVLPLFRGSYESAGIFYFDLVRLRSFPTIHEFRRLFFHKLLWAAPVIALYYWSLAALLGSFVLKDVPMTFLVALIPLFVVRSLIGMYQIRLFAEGRFGMHLATLVFLTVLLWLVWIKPDPASDLIEITAAMITQLILLINLQHFQDRRDPELPTLLALGDWLRALGRQTEPVRVGRLAIPDSVTSKQKSAATEVMQKSFGGNGYVAYRSPTQFVYFERTSNASIGEGRLPTHLLLQAVTGGTVGRGAALPVVTADGRGAIDALVAQKWLPAIDDPPVGHGGPEPLKSVFRELFPDGVAMDLETLEGAREMRSLEDSVLRRALPTAIACVEQGSMTVPLADRWLTPICYHGILRVLFILPADPEQSSLKRWRHVLRGWHVGCALPNTAGRADHG